MNNVIKNLKTDILVHYFNKFEAPLIVGDMGRYLYYSGSLPLFNIIIQMIKLKFLATHEIY